MHYVGAGTDFPFDLLARSLAECGADQPTRVVISDSDFDANYAAAPANARVFADAARSPGRLILLLHGPDSPRRDPYRKAGASVVPVTELENYPATAAALADALFEGGRHVPG
jgi:hypothetical protein